MRLVLCLMLALAAAPAWAEWVKVSENVEGDSQYIDPATIRVDGIFRRVWIVEDLKVKNSGALSMRGLAEYDCKEQRVRYLSWSWHSENMARGEVLGGNQNGQWGYIPPGTVGEAGLKIVCSQ